jgi:hypothetical protein
LYEDSLPENMYKKTLEKWIYMKENENYGKLVTRG